MEYEAVVRLLGQPGDYREFDTEFIPGPRVPLRAPKLWVNDDLRVAIYLDDQSRVVHKTCAYSGRTSCERFFDSFWKKRPVEKQ